MRKTPTRCPRASGSPSSRRSLRAADGAWAVSPMPRFTFVAGCEKLAPVMVKGRLLAHAAVLVPLILAAPAGASAQTAPPTLGVLVNQVLARSEEHTSELQSPCNLVCRLLLEKKKRPFRSQTLTF